MEICHMSIESAHVVAFPHLQFREGREASEQRLQSHASDRSEP